MNNINSFNIFSSQKHVYKNTTSDVFSLCNRYNWLQRINYIFLMYSLIFRPATIIFMAKITFSLSTKFWGVRKQSIFPDATTGFLRNDV